MANNLPDATSQILSGSYADSVLQNQLANQGQVPGSFVSPVTPNDYLFNPNAGSLVEAMLLAAHSPNAQLLEAQSLELGASMAPLLGAVSTWMNPRSSLLSKGIALAATLPLLSELGGVLGEVGGELGSLSAVEEQLPALGPELETSLPAVDAPGSLPNQTAQALAGQPRATIPIADLGRVGQITNRQAFRRLVTEIISDPSHPLHSLLDPDTGRLIPSTTKGITQMDWFENPGIIEAGHWSSAKSLAGAPDRFTVMSAYENRLASAVIESPRFGGSMLESGYVVAIGGLPVDLATAQALVEFGVLDADVLASAPLVVY
jgi:hypothetical protein